jgi:HlyD family secretion protein
MIRLLKKPSVLAGIALVVLLVAISACPKRASVDTATIERGPLRVTVDEEGETRVHDRFRVSAPVSGRVLRIELEPGDAVTRGKTVLATFRPGDPMPLDSRSRAEAEAAVGAARAMHAQARSAATLAQAELARHEKLAQEALVSREVLDVKEAAAREAELAAAAAEHELAMARARLLSARGGGSAPIVIRAPIDGVVLKRLRESEAVVPAGEPLLELGDPRNLEIVADFLSSDAVRISAGNPVVIERWGGDHDLGGRVRRVEPSGFMKVSALGVEEQRVNVVIDFADPVAAWKRLGDGYRVEVRVVIWQADDILKVPTSALFRRGEEWAAFAMDGGRARLRTLTLGQRNGLEAEVRAGLAAGDAVILHPSDSLTEGSRVRSRAVAP